MGNKEILFKKLDEILMGTYKYSNILGPWGKYVRIVIYPGYDTGDGYSAESYAVRPDKIHELEYQNVCNSCYENIHVSEYDPATNNYSIYINESIDIVKKNSKEIEELIRNIEILSIDACNIGRNLYLYSKSCSKLLIYFRRIIPNEKKIREEIKRSMIFGQSISDGGSKYKEQPVFRFTSLKGSETNIYDRGIKLDFPDYYRFGFIIFG
jgi:hypothetical protein